MVIDWGKLGPSSSPGPLKPDTTTPVAPSAPGSLPTLPNLPTPAASQTYVGGQYTPMSQEQVNALNPGERMGRGIDFLGNTLFGQGSPLGGIPLLGDILKGVGDIGHTVGDITVAKPFEIAAHVISHVPLGWIPGGADDTFKQFGDWAQKNDPTVYDKWLAVRTASDADILGGGNLKADFNMEMAHYIDDMSQQGFLGTTPALTMGRGGVGSLGGGLSGAIQGWLGLGANTAQRLLGGAGFFDTHEDVNLIVRAKVASGELTEAQGRDLGRKMVNELGPRNRVEASAALMAAGGQVSDVEKRAVEAWQSGAWTLEHAQDYLVSHGQSISSNLIVQMAGSVVTDPLIAASVGAGAIAKAGVVGSRIAAVGGVAKDASFAERAAFAASQEENLAKLQTTVSAVQQSQLGPAFRIARGLVDPFAVYKPSSVDRAIIDLRNGAALEAFNRAHGPQTVTNLRGVAREFDLTPEVDSAIASFSVDQANLMVAREEAEQAVSAGRQIELSHSNVDEVVAPLAQNAGRDAIDRLTYRMMVTAKNTFTGNELNSLAGRLAVTFGRDVEYWAKRASMMPKALKQAFQSVTYKMAEVGFEKARALVNESAYKGSLPLRLMVLMTDNTLDDVIAKEIIDNIRSVLKDANTAEPIAAATSEWNAQARNYPLMADIGIATGGKEQVETLVRELEKELERGGITKRALTEELADPELAPIQDWLDRNTVPGRPLTPDEITVQTAHQAAVGPEPGYIPNAPFTVGARPLDTFDSIVEGMGLPARNPDGTLPSVVLPKVRGTVVTDAAGKTHWEFPDGMPADAPYVPALDSTYANADELKLTAPDGTPMEVQTFKVEHAAHSFGIPGTERPIQYVYRAISEEDYQNILKTGVMKSDGRMNLSADEGTVASHRDPSWYLPGSLSSDAAGDYAGRIVKIKVELGDGWHIDGRDSYIKTSESIPANRIEMVSPKIIKTRTHTPSKYNTPERLYPDDVAVDYSGFEPDVRPSSLTPEQAAAKAAHDAEVAQYNAAKAAHDASVSKYAADKAAHDIEVAKYNAEVVQYNVAKAAHDNAVAASSAAKPVSAPHSYNVTARSAGQGKTGYHYVISGSNNAHITDSVETYATEAEAIASGNTYAQRMAEKVRADLAGPAAAPEPVAIPPEPVKPTPPVAAPAAPAAAPVAPVAPPPVVAAPAVVPSMPPQPLWRIGFRPDETLAWGFRHDPVTGELIVGRDPTISHVVDAVPGRQPFSDTTRNVLGQTIGVSAAERLNKPIESIEAFLNTMRDGITGQRLVKNIELRFEASTFDIGIPKPISREIWARARDVAGLEYTTVRGIKPGNLWKEIADIIPRDLRLADGSTLNVHIVMDHLLKAAEGDLRIMGVTSVMTQRMRNALRSAGLDPANWAGQMTVTMYNKLRYSQPTFLIQRITDAPYYSILYGVTPVGRAALKGALAATRLIEENLGRSGLARYFSMDMQEYATRSNFTQGIKSGMQARGLLDNKLDQIIRAPDAIIAANMTNMLHARLGDIVRGTLDNLATAIEKADPAFQAEMMAAHDVLSRSFDDWRRVYSEAAGRVLDDNEVGLAYIQDQLSAWRRHVVNPNGTIDMQKLIHEGERALPNEIGEIGSIRPDALAHELGSQYLDSAALRRDVTGHIEKINGVFTLVKGEHDLPWLEEQLREVLHAHPDYTRRVMAYYSETWDDFWTRLSRPVDQGGLDISPHYASEAQDLISIWAHDRGMDPWEFLSGVMASNIGAKDIETSMGQLFAFLKTGKEKMPLEEWTKIYRSTLDVSAQNTLLREFESHLGGVPGIEEAMGVPTPAPFRTRNISGTAATPGTPGTPAAPGIPAAPPTPAYEFPIGFNASPGYVHRVDQIAKMRGGLRKGEAVQTIPTREAIDGRPGLGVFRVKMDASQLSTGTANKLTGMDHVTLTDVPPEQIEMYTEKGWVALGPDPMNKIMAKDFPDLVRQRLITGTPHPDPEIEAYVQQFSKWVQDSMQPQLAGSTRSELRRLVAESGGQTGPLRPANPAIDEAIARVSAETPTMAGIGTQNDADFMRMIAPAKRNLTGQPGSLKIINNTHGGKGWKTVFYYGDDKQIAGTMSVHTGEGGGVYTVYVRPSLRRQGIGQKMYDAVQASGEMDLHQLIGKIPGGFSQEGKAFALKWLKSQKAADDLARMPGIPTNQARPFNRSQALIMSLLKDKIEWAQQDIFRLAEMQTKRNVLERSLNHPLFGLYPSSYMWGKVLPETVKFLAKNPYAATYAIADVQRAIAIQREYDRDIEDKVSAVDRSAGAFLLDYMTPSLPWSDHQSRMSPMVRDILAGDPAKAWPDELATVSPERWIGQIVRTGAEIPGAIESLTAAPTGPTGPQTLTQLQQLAGKPSTATPTATTPEITGPTKASALAPILQEDMSRLSSILTQGASPEQ